MATSNRAPLVLLVILLLASLASPALGGSTTPADSVLEPVTLPAETAHLVDPALAYLAAHPDLIEELKGQDLEEAPTGQVKVTLRVEKLTVALDYLQTLGRTPDNAWGLFQTYSTTVPLATLPALTYTPGLLWLEPNLLYWPTLASSVPAIGGDKVWTDYGLRGENTTIAILDTGINGDHEFLDDLDDDPNTDDPKILGFYDARSGSRGEKEPFDTANHGSHVSGIAAGTGGSARTNVGMAPQANLVGVIVCGSGGCSQDAILDGINWTIQNKNRFSIDVMSLSLGTGLTVPVASNSGNSALSLKVDAAVDAGIVATVAVGNGEAGACLSTKFVVSAPGDSKRAITVGWVDDNGNRNICSSQGPTGDGRTKPDVMAPGSDIDSADGSSNTGTRNMGGSSMSTPHVAGLAALMLQANPSLAPDENTNYVKQILHETSDHRTNYDEPYSPNNAYGWGTVDSVGAVQRALDLRSGTLTGPAALQTSTNATYAASFAYTKTEYTYQGENGDSHNPPLGSEAPDVVRLEVRLASDWPVPTEVAGDAKAASGLTATVELEDVREESGEWVIGGWFNYTGSVGAGTLARSQPTLSFKVNAPDLAGTNALAAAYALNSMPGESRSLSIAAYEKPPDLALSSFTLDPPAPTEGQTATLSVEVVNLGQGQALSGRLELRDGNPRGDLLAGFDLDPLAPGATQAFTHQWDTTGEVGPHTLMARLSEVTPAESDTSNNQALLPVEVHAVPSEENLPPVIDISSPAAGESLSGSVTVEGYAYDLETVVEAVQVRVVPGGWQAAEGAETWSWEWDTTADLNGDYTLEARAFDGELFSDLARVTVTVDNEGTNARPTADLTASPLAVRVGETVTFDAGGSSDDGGVQAYRFDFGDGGVTGWQSEATASHSYNDPGDYTASVKVRDDEGADSANVAEVTINVTARQPGDNRPPVAVISSPTPYLEWTADTALLLDGSNSSDPDGDALDYLWTSSLQGRLGVTAKLTTALMEGTHLITLTVDDRRGSTATDQVTIVVKPAQPSADRSGDDDDAVGDEGLPGLGLIMAIIATNVAAALVVKSKRRH